jgi:hypothetical protein
VSEARASDVVPRVLVFCNSLSSCRAVEAQLASRLAPSSQVAASHGALPSSLRVHHFASFVRGEAAVLVCTDLASRGLDLPSLTHVVQFDCALNPIDFLHRVGRLQRVSRSFSSSSSPSPSHPSHPHLKQRAITLVMKGDQVLSQAIQVSQPPAHPTQPQPHTPPTRHSLSVVLSLCSLLFCSALLCSALLLCVFSVITRQVCPSRLCPRRLRITTTRGE